MAQELTIPPEEIAAALRKFVESYEPSLAREEVGRVDQTRQTVQLLCNDALAYEATGGNLAGDVFRLVTWLANHTAQRCGGLRAGQVVTTGSCTGVQSVAPATRVRAAFPGIDSAEATL